MTPELPNDITKALEAKPDQPLPVKAGEQIVYIMTSQSMPSSYEEWVDRSLQMGVQQADLGLSEPWDVEHAKKSGRRLFEKRSDSQG